MFKGKTILIAPLDWGLGHATRCVPIIRELEKENKIILGVTPLTQNIFDEEFPHLPKKNVPAYNITYSRFLPLWLKLVLLWPGIKSTIKREQELVEKLVKELGVDLVISDNRFGFYAHKTHSVFITHQLFLKTPFAAKLAQKINRNFILRFKEVWVPDYEDENTSLSGELSHGRHYHPNVKYIGPKSRLLKLANAPQKYDVLFLLSGPEPQQSLLGKQLLKVATENPGIKFAMVSHSFQTKSTANLDFFQGPDAKQLAQLIAQSQKIVCRSGYSTLMDLHLSGKKDLVLIPTPGQTEQKYLAEYWCKQFSSKKIKHLNKELTYTFLTNHKS